MYKKQYIPINYLAILLNLKKKSREFSPHEWGVLPSSGVASSILEDKVN